MSKINQLYVKFNLLHKRIRELYDIGTHCSATDVRDSKDLDRLTKQFLVRFKDAEKYREQMEDIYSSLMADSSTDEAKRTDIDRVFNEYQELFYSVQVLHSSVNSQQSSSSNPNTSQKHNDFHLPKISLAKFSGIHVEWPNFIAVYNSLIHQNEQLGNIQKMHYLLSVLDKEPLGLVRHLPISVENYTVAYNLLLERYDNVRIIADKHIETILGLYNLTQVNIKTLTKFVFTIKENTQALKALKFDVSSWSFLLLHIILKKLPSELRIKFESNMDSTTIPTFEELLKFLENQLRILENVSSSTTKPYSNSAVNLVNSDSNFNPSHYTFTCPCCSEGHSIYKCPKFDAMSPTDRKSFVIQHKLCFNCLRTHHVSKCSSRSVCQICQGRHYTKLHLNNTPHSAAVTSNNTPAPVIVPNQSLHSVDGKSTMVLGTAVIHIQDVDGDYHLARALIDSGSQVSIMTENLAQKLRLPRTKSGTLLGLGGSVGQPTRGLVQSSIKSAYTSSHVICSDFVVLNKVTGKLPSVPVDMALLQLCQNLILADKNWTLPSQIDILLGVNIYDQIFNGDRLSLGENMPTAYSSIFGWVIMGKAPAASHYDTTALCTMACTVELTRVMSRFWEVEEPPKQLIQDPEQIQAERHFTETHRRDDNGRFIVRLPFKVDRKPLGDTHHTALKRFYNLERRLLKDAVLRELYVEFMRDYLHAGHMREVRSTASSERYYIPHHGVLKEHSSTTKLRAVFDASSPSSTGVALNHILMPGPKLQQNIEDIILRFRVHKIVFTGDVRQMYRQIKMADEDCRYQTIFWRESPEHQLKQYELSTVTYGVSSSAFQAIRVVHELAYLNSENHPEASRALLEDSFVDDIVTGASNIDSAQVLLQQLSSILSQGGFSLRKWSSNSPDLLSSLPADHCESPFRFENGDNIFKILGIEWNSSTDTFLYHVSEMNRVMTKRGVLSNIARLYDPCGFLAPVIFKAKVHMQAIWSLKCAWDDPLPTEYLNSWKIFLDDFHQLNRVSIPRRIIVDQPLSVHLHGFSDASERGYAACLYLRVESSCSTLVQLLTAKSRVAPLNQKLTIPKLELSGAFLLARLMEHASNILRGKFVINSLFAWTDSSIVLSWLNTSPHKLQTFEGNRVSQIQMLMPNVNWRHVPSSMNPADPASRGLSSSELVSHHLWWSPPWLGDDSSTWPGDIPLVDESDLPGVKPSPIVSAVAQVEVLPFSLKTIGTLPKLQSVVGWCKRFSHNTRNPSQRRSGPLSVVELTDSLMTIVKFVQVTAFPDALESLRAGKHIKGRLMRLNPFVDSHGLLRVGGRLVKSDLNYSAKHPLLMPKDHYVTRLIIEHYHHLFLHPGVGTLQTLLQRRFWILSARRVIKQVIFQCHRCYRLRPKSIQPFMGNLPSSRVTSCRPFQRVGIDFAGPFLVKVSKVRNARSTKAYLCMFVCFTTKCVHMEIVSELSTEAFIACLDRFVSRRGLPTDIYSDCGTNFVGTRNYLKEVDHFLKASTDKIYQHMTHHQITWHLNPPAAPHMGGLWESSIRSAKLILYRIIAQRSLLFEELATVFAKVESALNSRPLCPLSSDPGDLEVLTPGHFLIGQPLLALPEQNLVDANIGPLKRWQLLRQITQHFWQRWQSEYLHTLIHRPKWLAKTANIQIGDLVLIKDNSPPLQWRKGRVVRLCPGADGIVRVVELHTASGTLLRPVTKLCPLLSISDC